MKDKTFAEGVDELHHLVGGGWLKGEISVDQVYAHYQDSGRGPHGKPADEFDHPRGGEAGYLSHQIIQRRDEVCQRWANHILRGDLAKETIDMMMTIRSEVFARAPREFDVLRNSTALKLTERGVISFFAPAFIPRLSEAEIKAIRASSPNAQPRVYVRRFL